MNNSCTGKFVLDVNCVDYDKKYTLCALMRHFHDVVDRHALELGVDANTMHDAYGAYWIITRIRVDIGFMPDWHDEVTVLTYPLAPGLVRMDREALFSVGDRPFARLSSEWCLLDCKTNRPRRPAQTGYPAALDHLTERMAGEYSRLAPDYSDGDLAFAHTVRVSDLDMNVHMNNVAYIRLANDAFGVEFIRSHRLTSFEIAFKAQSYENEVINVYKKTDDGKNYYVSGVKPDGTRVFDTLFVFA